MYSSELKIILSIANEFPKRKKNEILRKLEEAYNKLSAFMEYERNQMINSKNFPSFDDISKTEKMEMPVFSGQNLQQIRKKLRIELYEISFVTKIRKELLLSIELERFDALPHESYLRGHIQNYAKYLSLDPKKVADDYIKLYREWKKIESEKEIKI